MQPERSSLFNLHLSILAATFKVSIECYWFYQFCLCFSPYQDHSLESVNGLIIIGRSPSYFDKLLLILSILLHVFSIGNLKYHVTGITCVC